MSHDKFYDQIAFYQQAEGITCETAGVLDYYDYVFDDESTYSQEFEKTNARSFKEWRTFQMSDHLIMWAQFDVDKTDIYLNSVLDDCRWRRWKLDGGKQENQAKEKDQTREEMTPGTPPRLRASPAQPRTDENRAS